MITLALPQDRLARLYPAYVLLGSDGAVNSCGPALTRRLADPAAALAPVIPSLAATAELGETGAPFTLCLTEPPLRLAGSVLPFDGGYLLAVQLVPTDPARGPQGFEIEDFSPDAPVVPAMMLAALQAALLDEAREVTAELVEARHHSEQLLQRISRASGHLAHEFNNLLSIVRLNCNRLLREGAQGAGGGGETARIAAIIADAAGRGEFITRSLMTLANQRDDSEQHLALDEVIAGHQAFFTLLLGSDVELTLALAAPGAVVRISHSGLVNCLVNLLVSIRDLAADRLGVTLSTRLLVAEGRGMVEIRIAATNAGAGGQSVAHWLALHRDGGFLASGLGRRSAESFAREAGGDLHIHGRGNSGEPDQENAIVMVLPRAEADRDSAPAPAALRVLLVDDEPHAVEALAELLEDMGHAVTPCESGAEALERFAPGDFDVLLTDVVMPAISGLELAEQACARDPALKVVVMSGYAPDTMVQRPEWLYLRKPLDVDRLEDLLATCRRRST